MTSEREQYLKSFDAHWKLKEAKFDDTFQTIRSIISMGTIINYKQFETLYKFLELHCEFIEDKK